MHLWRTGSDPRPRRISPAPPRIPPIRACHPIRVSPIAMRTPVLPPHRHLSFLFLFLFFSSFLSLGLPPQRLTKTTKANQSGPALVLESASFFRALHWETFVHGQQFLRSRAPRLCTPCIISSNDLSFFVRESGRRSQEKNKKKQESSSVECMKK